MTLLEMQRNRAVSAKVFSQAVAVMLQDQFPKILTRIVITGAIIGGASSAVIAEDSVAAFLAEGQFVWNSRTELKPKINGACSCKCELAVETSKSALMLDDHETTQIESVYYSSFTSSYGGTSYAVIKNCLFKTNSENKIVTCYSIDATTVSQVSADPAGNFYVAAETEDGSEISAVVPIATDRLTFTSPSLKLKNTRVDSMDVSPDGYHLAFSCSDMSTGNKVVKLWNLKTGVVDDLGLGTGIKFLISKIAIKADDQKSWTFLTWPELLPHSTMYTETMTLSPNRSWVLNHTNFNVYYHEHLDSLESGDPIWHSLRPFASSEIVTSCAFTADGSQIYCHTYSGELHNNQIADRHRIWQFQFPLINPDGTLVFEKVLPTGSKSTCPIDNYKALIIF